MVILKTLIKLSYFATNPLEKHIITIYRINPKMIFFKDILLSMAKLQGLADVAKYLGGTLLLEGEENPSGKLTPERKEVVCEYLEEYYIIYGEYDPNIAPEIAAFNEALTKFWPDFKENAQLKKRWEEINECPVFFGISQVSHWLKLKKSRCQFEIEKAISYVLDAREHFEYIYRIDESNVDKKEFQEYKDAFDAFCKRFQRYKKYRPIWERNLPYIQRLINNSDGW